jgi:hypothetical protein
MWIISPIDMIFQYMYVMPLVTIIAVVHLVLFDSKDVI